MASDPVNPPCVFEALAGRVSGLKVLNGRYRSYPDSLSYIQPVKLPGGTPAL